MDDEATGWAVFVEETEGSYLGRMISQWRAYDDREKARAAALELARTYEPQHPWSPMGRHVFRRDEDSYTVLVEGRTRNYYFAVSVAELVG